MPCSSTLELAAAAPEDEVVVNPLSNTVHAVSEVSTVETRCGWRFDGSGQRARRARTVTERQPLFLRFMFSAPHSFFAANPLTRPQESPQREFLSVGQVTF